MKNRILIIKLGALGDMVQATTAFAALRQYHKNDHLTLLTTDLYKQIALKMGTFDEVWVDEKATLYQVGKLFNFRNKLRHAGFSRVYDFQNVDRTKLYSFLLGKKSEWIAPHKGDLNIHPQERFAKLFDSLGIPFDGVLDLKQIADTDIVVPKSYVLLIPGASMAHGGRKKWPEESYAEIAAYLLTKGIQPVLIGGPLESWTFIKEQVPEVIDLCGKTTFYQVIGLGQNALFALGNDTGPTLLVASGGCPTLTLHASCNPSSLGGARGPNHQSLYEPDLRDLKVDRVIEKLMELIEEIEVVINQVEECDAEKK